MTGDELAVFERLAAVVRYRDACVAWWARDGWGRPGDGIQEAVIEGLRAARMAGR